MGKKILIVDDDVDALAYMKSALADENFEIETAEDGPQGIELARAMRPDLILLDIVMPKMNGMQVFKELKKDEATARIPVLFVTGLHERKYMVAAIAAGIEHYITKPFDPQEFVETIYQTLGNA